jgi:hypothetical protein
MAESQCGEVKGALHGLETPYRFNIPGGAAGNEGTWARILRAEKPAEISVASG